MADRRRGKQRRREDNAEKPSKEEYAIAKYLRFNLPVKEGKLVGITVQYFIATKAIDLLLESKWGPTKSKEDALFQTRSGCADYLDQLLRKGIFHRAAKVEKKKEKDKEREKRKRKPLKEEPEESGKEEKEKKKEKKTKKLKEKEEDKSEKGAEKDSPEPEKEKESEGEKEDKKDDEKRKKRKLKLEMHDYQVFKDGPEVYVWIYDPVPVKTFIIGLLLVLGAIAVCLFPLWPPEVRLGVYYLSLAAALFVGVILSLCVIRLVLFCLIWVCTFGHHHFWFLPNLTEDVGFLDSFRPLYKHDYSDGKDEEKNKKKIKKDSDSTKTGDNPEIVTKSEEEKDESAKKKDESGSENENSYEIVHKEEVDGEDEDDVPPLEGEGEEDEDEEAGLLDEEEDEEEDENISENASENEDSTETKKTK